MANGGAILGVAEQVELELKFLLFAIGDTQALSWDTIRWTLLHLSINFISSQRDLLAAASGCSIRSDSAAGQARFRDVEIGDNNLLFFPAHVVGAGLPVHCPDAGLEDRLFVLCGALRRGRAHD